MSNVESQIEAISAHLVEKPAPREIVVGDADYYRKPEMTLPESGLTVMYGTKGPVNVVSSMSYSATANRQLALVSFKVWIGQWNPNKLTHTDFDRTRFLNLPARASAPLMTDINRRWNAWLALEGKPEERFPRRPSMNMHLLDKLITVEPYNKLSAIAYEVLTEVGVAKFLTIFDESSIDLDSFVVGPDIQSEVVLEM